MNPNNKEFIKHQIIDRYAETNVRDTLIKELDTVYMDSAAWNIVRIQYEYLLTGQLTEKAFLQALEYTVINKDRIEENNGLNIAWMDEIENSYKVKYQEHMDYKKKAKALDAILQAHTDVPRGSNGYITRKDTENFAVTVEGILSAYKEGN